MEYHIYYVFDKTNNNYDYFLTRNNITKAIYSLKSSNKESILKTILNDGNYEAVIIKTFVDIPLIILKNELKIIKASHIHKKNILTHIETRDTSITYGKRREDFIYDLICKNHLFSNNIQRAKYIYSEFDFFDTEDCYLYEVKSLTYSINKYRTAVMNTSKLIYDNYLFIFEYTEADNLKELYYHLYDKNFNYNKRFITPFNRLNTCEIIDIPVNKLTKFYDGDKILEFFNPCSLITDTIDIETFKKLIFNDNLKSLSF